MQALAELTRARRRHRGARADRRRCATASPPSASQPRSPRPRVHRPRLRRAPRARRARTPATAPWRSCSRRTAASRRSAPAPARAEELRDRWRLAGEADARRGRPELRVGRRRCRGSRASRRRPRRTPFVGPVARVAGARRASPRRPGRRPRRRGRRARRGAPARPPPARPRSAPGPVAAGAGGLADAVASEPGRGRGSGRGRARAAVLEATERRLRRPRVDWSAADARMRRRPAAGVSAGQDLRLEGARCGGCGRLLFPPPVTCPHCGCARARAPSCSRAPAPSSRETRDHAYPVSRSTGMAVVDLDGGGRFYGQVVPSAPGRDRRPRAARAAPAARRRRGGAVLLEARAGGGER